MSTATIADGAAAGASLLPLKLIPPPLRDGVRLRPDLQSALAEVRLHPLTLVVAPAGYGKTTLLSRWASDLLRTGAPVCWLTLDSSERDPAAFLSYLIHTLQAIIPTLGVDALRILRSAAHLDRDWPLVAGAICSDLQRKMPTATFLFLDDLHLVADSAVIGQVLGYILRAAPPTLHVVAAARRAPTFAPLARMRTEGRIVDITQRDLHLTGEEARRLLAAQGVALADHELELLLSRTEGWALSLQLAARALADQPSAQRSAFVAALSGSQEHLFHYLSSEVLADLSAEVLEFLRLAAIPPYFDTELLSDVLARDDVAYLLRRTQVLGLPVLPIDEHGDQLRFHPLWRELLLRQIDDMLDGETRTALQRRFGRSLARRGDLEAAIDLYARAGAREELAGAVREHAWPLLQSPRRDTVRRWLEQIPIAQREHDAELLYMWGYSQIVSTPDQAVQAIEQAADLYRQQGLPARELRACSDLAAILFWQSQPTSFIAVCVRAIRAANQARDPWSRGAALVCVTAILAVKGRSTAAQRVARQAMAHPLNPAWHWLMAMIVSSIALELGQPGEALTMIDEALAVPQIDHDDRLRQNLLRQRAMALYEQGHLSEAITLALDVHRHLGDYYGDALSGVSAMQLALLLTLGNRLDEAATYITQARTTFHSIGALAPLASLQVIELAGHMARGQATRAAATVNGVLRRLDEAGGRAVDLRLRFILATILGEAGEYQRALMLTREIITEMEGRGYRLFLAVARLYAAYLANCTGDSALQEALLHAGWGLAEQDAQQFLPLLPGAALQYAAAAALRSGVAIDIVGQILVRQVADQGLQLFQELLNDQQPAVRERAVRLLGGIGAAAAYVPLRSMLKDRHAAVRSAAEEALSRIVYRPPYTLRIRTLGAFTIWRGEHEVRDRDWRSSKARQLFQLLLTERGRAIPRDRLLDILWPDMDPEAAANNLRVTMNRLSKALEPDRPEGAPPSYLQQQSDTYSLNTETDIQLDVVDFIAAIEAGQHADQLGQRQPTISALRRAVMLYGGMYLPDTMYEDWSVVERERLALMFNDAAIRLGGLLLEEGEAHEAIGLAWRVLEQDRANEESYRLLMRAHASLGERSTALRIYTRCVAILEEDLGVEPLAETTALYQALRDTSESDDSSSRSISR